LQEHASKGLTAEHWAAEVSKIVGGRSGGKEPTRTGQGTNPEKIEEAVKVAEKWFAEKLKL
jgi:alanyl-tRNA synthetase